jgi:hypothetical protein
MINDKDIASTIDSIFRWIDDCYDSGNVEAINDFLISCSSNPYEIHPEILIAIISISQPAYYYGKLPVYKELWEVVSSMKYNPAYPDWDIVFMNERNKDDFAVFMSTFQPKKRKLL